ncbi:SIS domain-containing protein [Streptomyces sp. NPDC055089]
MTVHETFSGIYLGEVAQSVRRMGEQGSEVAELLHRALASGGQICAFGNGGSSAIVRSALLQLRADAGRPGTEAMISPAALAYSAQQHGYSGAFARSLAGGIDAVSLLIVASVSGRSANVLEAVGLCRNRGVPVLALVGGDGTQFEPGPGMVWASGTTDQQVSEDAMLSSLTLSAAAALHPAGRLASCLDEQVRSLAGMATAQLGVFLQEATHAVADAVTTRRPIYVLCPEGGPLALAGEHYAHNLSWDAPLGVDGVQPPLVICDPSLADLSAIYNDHPDPAHGVRYQLRSASAGDVVFLLAYDTGGRTTQEAVRAAREAGVRLFVVHRDGATPSPGGLRLPAVDDFALASLTQSIAHLICRTTRATLTHRTGGSVLSLHDLMTQDLAPLRELSSSPAPSL